MKGNFTVRVEHQNPVHTRLSVFNRGGLAGQLTILTTDVQDFVQRLKGGQQNQEENSGHVQDQN